MSNMEPSCAETVCRSIDRDRHYMSECMQVLTDIPANAYLQEFPLQSSLLEPPTTLMPTPATSPTAPEQSSEPLGTADMPTGAPGENPPPNSGNSST